MQLKKNTVLALLRHCTPGVMATVEIDGEEKKVRVLERLNVGNILVSCDGHRMIVPSDMIAAIDVD